MQLAIPKFQFRFVPALGNVIHPGNFHPVGAQRIAEQMVARCERSGTNRSRAGQCWLVVGGSGGFGSAARLVLGIGRGADTINVSLDGQPNPDSSNKVRKIGSPGFHRNLAIERTLRARGRMAQSIDGDAFDPQIRARVIELLGKEPGRKLDGVVWALAAPRAIDSRTGQGVASALRPLGASVAIKTFTGRDGDEGPKVSLLELTPGTPEEAIATIFVMGGQVVAQWINALRAADALAPGFQLLTISYRGNALNEGVYRRGLIGLAKADLEFHTRVLDHQLAQEFGGRAVAIEGPAVVTEASGGIPGVPFYMAHLLDVMRDRFEDPLDSMLRMFVEHFDGDAPKLDGEKLLRMDDRELAGDVQAEMATRFDASTPGQPFPPALYERFMAEYARTRGFEVSGLDYEAEFDTDAVCQP